MQAKHIPLRNLQPGQDNFVGTMVSSTRPIAITIKDDSVIKETCRDGFGDQMIPANVAGTEYTVTRGFLRPPEYMFIMATEDNTEFIHRESIYLSFN